MSASTYRELRSPFDRAVLMNIIDGFPPGAGVAFGKRGGTLAQLALARLRRRGLLDAWNRPTEPARALVARLKTPCPAVST